MMLAVTMVCTSGEQEETRLMTTDNMAMRTSTSRLLFRFATNCIAFDAPSFVFLTAWVVPLVVFCAVDGAFPAWAFIYPARMFLRWLRREMGLLLPACAVPDSEGALPVE